MYLHLTIHKIATPINMPYLTIKEFSDRMKRAKKRALKRAKRYNIGKKPPFERGIIDGELFSPYRMLAFYADRITPHWDGDPDDKPSICEIEDIKKLIKDLYIYCTCAARIVTRGINNGRNLKNK